MIFSAFVGVKYSRAMLTRRGVAAPSRLIPPVHVAVRAFKTQKQEAAKLASAQKAKDKALGGRDPFGLFKQALSSEQDENLKYERRADWKELRAEYSRNKMLEHHRVGAHYTKMIKARDAAIAALPEQLQAEARQPDHTLLPVQRRVFTETAPIPDFQKQLTQQARTDS